MAAPEGLITQVARPGASDDDSSDSSDVDSLESWDGDDEGAHGHHAGAGHNHHAGGGAGGGAGGTAVGVQDDWDRRDERSPLSKLLSRLCFCCCGDKRGSGAGAGAGGGGGHDAAMTAARTDGMGELQLTNGYLLGPQRDGKAGKKCLVLDLDETLVHSSFKPVPNADFIVPVEIDDVVHKVYVLKRPGVDAFMQRVGELFEIVVFTASLAKYADPVLDLLDKHRVVDARLFREACSLYRGNYVKDLNLLGRDLKDSIIIDNSPASYLFHNDNAIGCESWFDDPHDTELLDLLPFLETLASCDNVMTLIAKRRR